MDKVWADCLFANDSDMHHVPVYKADDVADFARHIIDYLKPLIKDFNDRCDGRCFPKVLPDWAQVKYDKGTALIAELEQIAGK